MIFFWKKVFSIADSRIIIITITRNCHPLIKLAHLIIPVNLQNLQLHFYYQTIPLIWIILTLYILVIFSPFPFNLLFPFPFPFLFPFPFPFSSSSSITFIDSIDYGSTSLCINHCIIVIHLSPQILFYFFILD